MSFMPKAEIKEEIEVADARVYELGYLLVPTITDENIGAVYTNLKDLIQDFGGAIIIDEMPKMTPLNYSMLKVVSNIRNKFNNAYFGWIKLEMDTEKVLELKKKLDLDPNLIRFLIIKTVRENTIATKRFVGRDTYRKRPAYTKREGAVPVEINKEEIDKEIDALAAV